MMTIKKILGDMGEAIAVDYLLSQGYQINERNYHSRQGEIDIITEDRGVLCFVEVKYYQQGSLRNLWDAVNYQKQKKMIQTARYYLFKKKIVKQFTRFDVVLIEYNNQERISKIDLVRDAFRP